MPRHDVILYSKPKIEFFGKCSLIPCINIVLVLFPGIGGVTIPIIPSPQTTPEGTERLCRWDGRIILVAREGTEKGIKRASRRGRSGLGI